LDKIIWRAGRLDRKTKFF